MITYRNKRRRNNRINNRLNHTEMKQSNVNMGRLIAIVVAVVLGVSLISCEKPELPLEERDIKVTAMFYPITGNTSFISDDTPIEHYLDDTATPLRTESVFTNMDADNNWDFVKGEIGVVVQYAYAEHIRGGGYGGHSYYVVLAVEGAEGLKGTKPNSEWIDNYFEGLWASIYTTTYIYNHSFKSMGLDQKPSQIYYKAEHLYRYNESILVQRFDWY